MAHARRLIALALVAALAPGCRWWRRRHPAPHRAAAHEVATECYDARYVTGQRVPQSFTGVHPAVAGRAGARVFAWRAFDGVYGWWQGTHAPVRLFEGATTEGPTVALRRDVAVIGWGAPGGSSLRVLAADNAVGAYAWWPDASHAVTAASGEAVLWVAHVRDGALAARSMPGGDVRVVAAAGASAAAVAALADGFVVAWTAPDGDASVLRGRVLGLNGLPRGETFDVLRVPGAMGAPAVARAGGRLLFGWSDHRSGDAGLHVAATDLAGGAVGPVQRLSIRYRDDLTPSIAANGRFFGVAWSEPVAGGVPRSYFARVDAGGRRLGSAMRVAIEDDSALAEPSLARDNAGYVMAMSRGDGTLELRRTGPQGCDMPLE